LPHQSPVGAEVGLAYKSQSGPCTDEIVPVPAMKPSRSEKTQRHSLSIWALYESEWSASFRGPLPPYLLNSRVGVLKS